MTAYTTKYNQFNYCTSFAAEGTSMRFSRILDTVIRAVSILISRLGLLIRL